jgi:hypothetical protein
MLEANSSYRCASWNAIASKPALNPASVARIDKHFSMMLSAGRDLMALALAQGFAIASATSLEFAVFLLFFRCLKGGPRSR